MRIVLVPPHADIKNIQPADTRLDPVSQEQGLPQFGLFRPIPQSSKLRLREHGDMPKPSELLSNPGGSEARPPAMSSLRVGTCLSSLLLKPHAQPRVWGREERGRQLRRHQEFHQGNGEDIPGRGNSMGKGREVRKRPPFKKLGPSDAPE